MSCPHCVTPEEVELAVAQGLRRDAATPRCVRWWPYGLAAASAPVSVAAALCAWWFLGDDPLALLSLVTGSGLWSQATATRAYRRAVARHATACRVVRSFADERRRALRSGAERAELLAWERRHAGAMRRR